MDEGARTPDVGNREATATERERSMKTADFIMADKPLPSELNNPKVGNLPGTSGLDIS